MNNELKHAISECIYGKETIKKVSRLSSITGGSINNAALVEFDKEKFFVKWNSNAKFPLMFQLEANGLQGLAESGAIAIPNVIGHGEIGEDAFLVLEYIEEGSKGSDFWQSFGEQLAAMHQNDHKLFGWHEDNYIGSLFQSNARMSSWSDFYIVNRLDAQLELAFNSGKIHHSISRSFNKLYAKLDELLPLEKPALIHGDLWSGNYMVSSKGDPLLIDPAVYYGHREMDLGMMHLFGGFGSELFQSYNQIYPLQPDWKERISLHQLYPLLVHVNLFGGGYVSQVESVLRRFV